MSNDNTVRRSARVKQQTLLGSVELESESNLPHSPLHMVREESAPVLYRKDGDEEPDKSLGLGKDKYNIALLMFLYVLQGIPLGLAGSIPYLLSSRHVSYKDQAIYSFVYWPFSVKLLWAPIVDSVFIARFGRRKSWLVPIQYLIGVFMLVLSPQMPSLLGEGSDGGAINVFTLTVVFFCLNFLAATQDIAVDGWALTMLSRRNVGWASTCNTVGQTAGYFLGNVVFIALESAEFCNKYIRSEPLPDGLVTLGDFLYFWGIVFFVTTTLVMILKSETDVMDPEDMDQGVVDTYHMLWKVFRLPAVMSLIGILLTAKMGFAAADAVTGLKLIDGGVPKEKLALLGVPMVPIQIILPLIISKYTTGPSPMKMFLKAYPYRLFMGLVFMGVVMWAPTVRDADGNHPLYFYAAILVVYSIHQIALYTMFVTQMAMFAKISDPAIGGTYMTLLNTITNFGGNWPSTVALWCVDALTWKACEGAAGECGDTEAQEACTSAGGSCITSFDGYFVESVICVIIGLIWLKLRSRKVSELQELPPSAWTCQPQ